MTLQPTSLIGALSPEAGPVPIPGATWYTAQSEGDGLDYRFPAGTLAVARYLTADLLLAGADLATFTLYLQEGEDGPLFGLNFGLLNQCQARLRMPLDAVNQNRWLYPREGAWLKPRCLGARVDLRRVDRLRLVVERKSAQPVRWCMTPLTATADEPPLLTDPMLPRGALLDELGQSTLRDWPAKSRSPEEVTARLQQQLAEAPDAKWPAYFSRWGGWTAKRFAASGYFQTHHDGARWWLVDPDGYAFWSSGLDCVEVDAETNAQGIESALAWRPDPYGEYADVYRFNAVNYLAANLIRAFGPRDWYNRWAGVALAALRRCGFNTIGNWSDFHVASVARFPYVRPLEWGDHLQTPNVYRDFPDVFAPAFKEDARRYAEQLIISAEDPAMIGYFLMNEPEWGFADEPPAAGMLFNTPRCHSRRELALFLEARYGSDAALAQAWGPHASFDAVSAGEWRAPLNEQARRDLAEFSAIMVVRFFKTLSDACRAVDPHHLNLGARYYKLPPDWALAGMRTFDVFSMNCYKPLVPPDELERIHAALDIPVLIGEWHFGALDAGLPAPGIGHVRDQAARGQAFRVYVENAAASPYCVGAHYFILYDQSALGRFDGENYNIGFLDVCHRPYEPLVRAARATHERLYAVASGQTAPFDDPPEYLPLLFM
jgi:hypothetical protein